MSFLWLFKTKTLTNRIFTVLWSIRLCFWWCNMYACLPPTQDIAIDCFWLRMFEPLNINIWVIPEKILKNKKSNANEVEWNNCQPTNKTLNIPIARLVPHCEPAWGWPGVVWRGESPTDLEIFLALLGSQDFDPQPTAKRDRIFSALTPLIIRFYCIFKLQFPKK